MKLYYRDWCFCRLWSLHLLSDQKTGTHRILIKPGWQSDGWAVGNPCRICCVSHPISSCAQELRFIIERGLNFSCHLFFCMPIFVKSLVGTPVWLFIIRGFIIYPLLSPFKELLAARSDQIELGTWSNALTRSQIYLGSNYLMAAPTHPFLFVIGRLLLHAGNLLLPCSVPVDCGLKLLML